MLIKDDNVILYTCCYFDNTTNKSYYIIGFWDDILQFLKTYQIGSKHAEISNSKTIVHLIDINTRTIDARICGFDNTQTFLECIVGVSDWQSSLRFFFDNNNNEDIANLLRDPFRFDIWLANKRKTEK